MEISSLVSRASAKTGGSWWIPALWWCLMAALGAFLLALTLPLPACCELSFVALVPFLLALRPVAGRHGWHIYHDRSDLCDSEAFHGLNSHHDWLRRLLIAFVFSYLYFFITMDWLGSFGMPARLLSAFIKALVPTFFWAAFTWLLYNKWEGRRAQKCLSDDPGDFALSPWLLCALWSSAWVVQEWLQQLGFSGLTWGMLSYALAERPALLQLCSLTGDWGLTVLVVWINAALAETLWSLRVVSVGGGLISPHPTGGLLNPRRFFRRVVRGPLLTGLLALLVWWGLGMLALSRADESASAKAPLTWGVLQVAVPQEMKFAADSADKTFAYLCSKADEAASRGAEVVLWPETSVPYSPFFSKNKHMRRHVSRLMSLDHPVWQLMGSLERTPEGLSMNTTTAVDPQGHPHGSYAKYRLVPFGEYLPFRSLLQRFSVFDPVGHCQPGEGSKALSIENTQGVEYKAGSLICFESFWPDVARAHVLNGAEFLLVPTNDIWFGETRLAEVHFRSACVRAAEFRRPVIQAANTGISGFIDANGRVLEESRLNDSVVMVRSLAPGEELTLYARWGDWMVWLCGAVLVCGAWLYRRESSRPELPAAGKLL